MKSITRAICLVLLLALGVSVGACNAASVASNTSTSTSASSGASTNTSNEKTITITTTVTWAGPGTSTPENRTTTTTEKTEMTRTPMPATTATKTLASTATTSVEQVKWADQGFIFVDGQGTFKYQRVFEPVNEAVDFGGVVFSPYDYGQGKTVSGPVAFSLTASFQDGTTEQLSYVGLGSLSNVTLRFTKHSNPRAGVMLAWQQIGGSLRSVMYLLVSS
ncbi:MAG: hypothetical protein HYX87_04475 [Chloroflexi bacterium]|nr:hypothetical protein [Chloroflexota bacterium]